ncbi:2-aminoethylphosphonate--pyruvate transaminase [Paenibacillus sp. LHD-117]|uniref:2-aminoethylphosphonate--pyruvate transaminase n=1 Tax=Paenibacillus sp. LHD-117 TaxID=3071412 RepID=UPI0027DF1FB9|nr:2-aminoethylphosphonate--pyruvate transaminase [Paenibacillus sp. LHD-117]MDQ6420659.1 2-aminoethylphosphonate--pyruvate transaminase [Paenibacillus sp. LHD-117]
MQTGQQTIVRTDTENPYLLLTPGPLTTTRTVKEAMLKDWCTWDEEYNGLVRSIRDRLTTLAAPGRERDYTAVLMQGSGTFSVEATIGTALPKEGGKLAIAVNGAYGERIVQIAQTLGIETAVLRFDEREPVDPAKVSLLLSSDPAVTHFAVVHCETTTGILNPLAEIASAVRDSGVTFIVDAMSSFGGIPMDIHELGAHFLISSSNKCIQGVPGFGFVIAERETLKGCKGRARSLSLDLYDQWETMESSGGKWRYTSPTHVVRAFDQALQELEQEGGIAERHRRFAASQSALVSGLKEAGFEALLAQELQSPIITAFRYPSESFDFSLFYQHLKSNGFVLYPGKLTAVPTFRIGSIGDVSEVDMERLTAIVKTYMEVQ